jgi:hypothetical protein
MRLTRRGWRAVGARRARALAAARADASSGRERRSRAVDQPRASGWLHRAAAARRRDRLRVAARSVSPAPSGANPGALALARGRRRLGARRAGAWQRPLAVLPSDARWQTTPRTLPLGMQPTNAAVLAGVLVGAWPASPARRSRGCTADDASAPGQAGARPTHLAVLPPRRGPTNPRATDPVRLASKDRTTRSSQETRGLSPGRRNGSPNRPRERGHGASTAAPPIERPAWPAATSRKGGACGRAAA